MKKIRKSCLLLALIGSIGLSNIFAIEPAKRIKSFTPLVPEKEKREGLKKAPSAQLEFTTILSEDFSGCSKGTLSNPDSEGIAGSLPSGWTKTTGWNAATAYQAGGAIYIDEYNYNGETVRLLDTPVLGTDATVFKLNLRACAPKLASGKTMPLYVIHAVNMGSAANTVDLDVVDLTNQWQDYEIYFTSGQTYSFIEFQADDSAYAIDELSLAKVADLPAPNILPATEITDSGYTANWESVSVADGYQLQPRVMHTADGTETYWLINSDFSTLTEGTTSNPVMPSSVIESLDGIVEQNGWLGRMVLKAKGALGITNAYYSTYGFGVLQSPTLDLSSAGGRVTVKMRYMAQDVDMFQVQMYRIDANGGASMVSNQNVYTGDVYNKWIEEEFTLGGGSGASMVAIMLPYTTSGAIFFDNLEISQIPDKGFRYIIPGSTIETTETYAKVSTPGLGADDTRSYSVRSYAYIAGMMLMSVESQSIIVGADSAEEPESLEAPSNVVVSVNGAQFTATWPAVKGANSYEVQVFKRHEALTEETITVFEEDFSGIRVGTTDLDRPKAMNTDGYDVLDAYTKVPGWEAYQGVYVDGAVGILGYYSMMGFACYLQSPKIDLSQDGGKMILSLNVGSDYYNQGATVFLAHDDPETGKLKLDEELDIDNMVKGFKPFITNFSKGREDSYLLFFPYGYGVSYFDDIKITQKIPAGTWETRVMSRTVSQPTITLVVPGIDTSDSYYLKVRALWRDSYDNEKVTSDYSSEKEIPNLRPSTTFSGIVQDGRGTGIANAVVTLTPDTENGETVTTTTNRWGIFQADNIYDETATYIATAKATGYRTGVITDLRFEGLSPIENATFTLREAEDESVEVGLPTGYSQTGALYLQYNSSESETIYPAELLNLPKGARIKEISFDGYGLNDKEISPTITLTVANTEDESYSEAAPGMGSDGKTFWRGSYKLNMKGSAETPETLLHFTNSDGFIYEGHGLRVGLTSTGTKNSPFYFMVDRRYPSHSIYRYGNRSADSDWMLAHGGLPVMRVLYEGGEQSGASLTESEGVTLKCRGGHGDMTLLSSEDTEVTVYDIAGRSVAHVALDAGEEAKISLPAGIYFAAGNKVVVK